MVRKREKYAFFVPFIFLSMILILNLTLAEIVIVSQPEELYNLGDDLEIVVGTGGVAGDLKIELNCKNHTKLIYFDHVSDGDNVEVVRPLTKSFLRGMRGLCNLLITFGTQVRESQSFRITDEINSEVKFNKNNFNPGENVEFSGTATKPNGDKVEGFAEIRLEELGIENSFFVRGGKFSGNFTLPSDIAAGDYSVILHIYEKDSPVGNLSIGEITNQQLTNFSISVNQVPTYIDIILNNEEFKPGETIEFKATLYDQAGYQIDDSIGIEIIDINEEVILKKLVSSGVVDRYNFNKNVVQGAWLIKAKSNALEAEKIFYMGENEEAEFILLNDSLTVINVGNVIYDEIIEIKIGNYTETKQVELELGESVEFKLSAPDGNYDIEINDGITNITQEGVALTGNVVAIRSTRRGIGKIVSKTGLVWIFIILIMGLFIIVTARKTLRGKITLRKPKERTLKEKIEHEKKLTGEKTGEKGILKVEPKKEATLEEEGKGIKVPVPPDAIKAEHSLVIKGQKQDAVFLALKIKNYEELIKKKQADAINKIRRSIESIPESKGRIYNSGNYVIGILAPSLTKTFKNELNAVKIANQIKNNLSEHNKKYADKIQFGIGVHSGNIVGKQEAEKFIFTTLGKNSLVVAKKIADIANNDVLLSDETHRKVIPEVKTQKNIEGEKDGFKTYSIRRIVDREKNARFIQEFLKRQKEGR